MLAVALAAISIATTSLQANSTATLVTSCSWLAIAATWCFLGTREKPAGAASASLAAWIAGPASVLSVPLFYDIHPVAWIQLSVIGAFVWAVLAQMIETWLCRRNETQALAASAFTGPIVVGLSVGSFSGVIAILATVAGYANFVWFMQPIGLMVTVLAVVYGVTQRIPTSGPGETQTRVPVPIAVTLLSGQLAWLSGHWSLPPSCTPQAILSLLLTVAAIMSLVRFYRIGNSIDRVHLVALSVLSLVVYESRDVSAGFLLTILALTGMSATIALVRYSARPHSVLADRLTIVFVIAAQGWTLVNVPNSAFAVEYALTYTVLCDSAWIIATYAAPWFALPQAQGDPVDRADAVVT